VNGPLHICGDFILFRQQRVQMSTDNSGTFDHVCLSICLGKVKSETRRHCMFHANSQRESRNFSAKLQNIRKLMIEFFMSLT